MGILIRRAELKDIEAVLIELKKFSDFFNSKYQLFGDDDAYNHKVLSILIDRHVFYVAEKSEEIIGFITGTVSPHFFNPMINVLTELFWWMREDHRHSFAGARLFYEFMAYGKKNCQWIIMTLEEHSPVKKQTLLSRGFKLKESAFIMEI